MYAHNYYLEKKFYLNTIKMPPAIVPQITIIIMLLPEKTEPECLDHDMLIYSKSATVCRISHLRKY